MIAMLRTMPDAAALAAAGQTPLFPLFPWDLQVLTLPQAMDSLVVHSPASQQAITVQQAMHALAAIPWMEFDYPPHLAQQQAILIHLLRLVTLRAAWLVQDAAGSSLGNLFRPQTLADSFYCPPPTFGAYKFGRAASRRICMSRACSATSRFSLAFSFCNSCSCLASFGSIEPYFVRQR
jgi:hypothetical protein